MASSYARGMHEEGHQHAPMEDLADAVSYYRRTPVYMLQKGAKERFRHINILFGAYDSHLVAKTITYLQSAPKPGDPDYDSTEQFKEARKIFLKES